MGSGSDAILERTSGGRGASFFLFCFWVTRVLVPDADILATPTANEPYLYEIPRVGLPPEFDSHPTDDQYVMPR
jgi:hypothetical protein